MHRPPSPSKLRRSRATRSVCLALSACVFGVGLVASGVFSGSVQAAPQDCLPAVGCVTTTIPSLPLPTVTVPTLPTSTTTTTAGHPAAGTTSTQTQTTAAEESRAPESEPETAFVAKASVRVRGHGAKRTVEIRLSLSRPARVSALLTRGSRTLGRRQVSEPAGSSVLVIRIGRGTKAGPARLALTHKAASGEAARASYRLHLPR